MIALRSIIWIQGPLLIISLVAAFASPFVSAVPGSEQGSGSFPFFLSAGIGAISLFAVFRGQMERLRQSQSSSESASPSRTPWQAIALVATTGSAMAFVYGVLGTTGLLVPN